MKDDELIFDQVLLNLYHYVSSVQPSLLAHGNYAVFSAVYLYRTRKRPV